MAKTEYQESIVDTIIPNYIPNVESPQDVDLMNSKLNIIQEKFEDLVNWSKESALINFSGENNSLKLINGNTTSNLSQITTSGDYLIPSNVILTGLPAGSDPAQDRIYSVRFLRNGSDVNYSSLTEVRTGKCFYRVFNASTTTYSWKTFKDFLTENVTTIGSSLIYAENAAAARVALELKSGALLDAPASGNATVDQLVKGNDTRLLNAANKNDSIPIGEGLIYEASELGSGLVSRKLKVNKDTVVMADQKGVINGVAPLNADKKIDADYLPPPAEFSLTGSLHYIGQINRAGEINAIQLNKLLSNASSSYNAQGAITPEGGFYIYYGETGTPASWLTDLNLKVGDMIFRRGIKWVPIRNTAAVDAINKELRSPNVVTTERAVVDYVGSELDTLNNGLGTAAYKDVGEDSDHVMQVGAFGLGGRKDLRSIPWAAGNPSDVFGKGFVTGFISAELLTPPPVTGTSRYGTLEVFGSYSDSSGLSSVFRRFTRNSQTFISYAVNVTTWSEWVEVHHSGNLPATATSWPTWAQVSSKPSTFTPSSHKHASTDITGLGNAATKNTGTTSATVALGNILSGTASNASTRGGLKTKLVGTTLHMRSDGTNIP